MCLAGKLIVSLGTNYSQACSYNIPKCMRHTFFAVRGRNNCSAKTAQDGPMQKLFHPNNTITLENIVFAGSEKYGAKIISWSAFTILRKRHHSHDTWPVLILFL